MLELRAIELDLSPEGKEWQRDMSITGEYLSSVQNVMKKFKFFKLGFSFQSFSSGFSTTTFCENRSVCFLSMPSTTSIYSLVCKSLQWGNGSNDAKLEHGSSICISPFSMISRVLLKIKKECVLLLILTAPVWSTQPWYPVRRYFRKRFSHYQNFQAKRHTLQ